MPRLRRFLIVHALLPGALFLAAYAAIALLHADHWVAQRLFYDANTGRWLGAGRWWANQLLHDGGRNLVRAIAASALLTLLAASVWAPLRPRRRAAAYVLLSIVLATGIVGALKAVTNVDCPWDLAGFGGTRPYVGLFIARPDHLPRARCFPGAHSSSGFALLCFYFLLRDRRPRAARVAFACGTALGLTFAFGQQARGAHFLSHDLTSAAVVWFVLLGLYILMWRPIERRNGSPHATRAEQAAHRGLPDARARFTRAAGGALRGSTPARDPD